MNIKNLLLGILMVLTTQIFAQDKHFTLYDMAPLRINPANTGAFEGTVRVGGIYRNQSSLGKYRTPSFYADAPILMLGKRNWVGVGFLFLSDKAGSLDLGETQAALSGSIHRMMDKKGKTVMTLGLQMGQVSRKLSVREGGVDPNTGERTGAIYGHELSGISQTEALTMGDDPKGTRDFAVGLLLKTEMNKTTDLRLGVSFQHLLQPEYNFLDNMPVDNNKRPLTAILHGGLDIDLNEKMSFNPSFFIQTTQGTPLELAVQGWLGFMLDDEKDIKLNVGLGYRASDAGEILVGMDYGPLKAALSYDVTLSSQNNQSPNYFHTGGFELSAYYIFKVFKKPTVTPAILCPKL